VSWRERQEEVSEEKEAGGGEWRERERERQEEASGERKTVVQ
jgi:hypothetical protein